MTDDGLTEAEFLAAWRRVADDARADKPMANWGGTPYAQGYGWIEAQKAEPIMWQLAA